jgi:hypothetical protein
MKRIFRAVKKGVKWEGERMVNDESHKNENYASSSPPTFAT